MLAPHVGAGVGPRWGGSRAGAIEDRPTRAAIWECHALLGARKGKLKFRFRSATYKDGTTRAQCIGREQPGRLVPVRRVPQVLAQLEGILESHHPGRRGRGNWAAWTQATVDDGEWFWSVRSTRLVRQEEVVNDCRSEAKSKGSQKDYSRVVQKHKMRLGRNGRRDLRSRGRLGRHWRPTHAEPRLKTRSLFQIELNGPRGCDVNTNCFYFLD